KVKPVLARRAYGAALLTRGATGDDYEAYVRLAVAGHAFDEARTRLASQPQNDLREGDSPARELCLAILDEAAGGAAPGRAAALCGRMVHPLGAAFPHASPEAQIACDYLAAA